MPNIIGINGSPKINKGVSFNILKYYTSKVVNSNTYNNKDIKQIKKNDIIIFSFPLYVDSLPSHFLKFLIDLENNKVCNKKVYAICNLGFYEGKQGKIALDIINNFCIKTNNSYMGGICIGGGPIINYPIITYNIKRKLKHIFNYIINNKSFNNIYISPIIPRFIYLRCANYNFKKQIKHNLIKNNQI